MLYCINNGHESRREILHEHLKKRGIYDSLEVQWMNGWTKNDPFVKWLHATHAPHVSVEGLSGHVKLCESMSKFFEKNEDFFMFSDDDVVFPENWKELISNLPPRPINIICMGVNFHLKYDAGYTITHNVGGMECMIISREMVQFILDNIDFGQSVDIVIGAIMNSKNMALAVTPICHQTSLLDTNSTYKHNVTKYPKDWVQFTLSYKPTGLKYSKLKRDFEIFMEKKKCVEDAYFKRFATVLDIWNIDYIEKQYSLRPGTL